MIDALAAAVNSIAARLRNLEARPWNPYSPDADFFDHFAGDGTIDARWTTTLVLTGTASLPNATPTYVRLSSGATANSTARLDWSARYPLVGMAKGVDVRWRARIPTAVDTAAITEVLLTNAANTRIMALGFVGSVFAGNFAARTAGSTGTQNTAGPAVDTAWHDCRIQAMPDRVRYYIDNVMIAEHTLTADTLQTDPLQPWLRAMNGATAADRQMDVDLIWLRENR